MSPERAPSLPITFYEKLPDGDRRCRVCAQRRGHTPTCPLLALRIQVQELASQIGCHVATMRELLDDVDALLRGAPEPPAPPGPGVDAP